MKNTLDAHFVRNTVGISIGEFLWGMGFPVLIESTFLQVFLSAEGASNTVIGLTGTIYFLSISVMPLFSAWFSSRYARKRTLLVLLHIVPSLSILFLGLFYYLFGARFNVVNVFLVYYLLFSVSIALTLPVWQHYVVKIFSEKKRLKGFSVMMMTQNAAKLCAGLCISFLITARGFSLDTAALLFTLTGIVFTVGSFAYAFTYEEPDEKYDIEIRHPFHYVHHYTRHIFKNRAVKFFILSDLEFFSVTAVFAFYARFAVEEAHVSKSIAGGAFAAVAFAGAVCASLMFGFFWQSNVKGKLYASKFVSLAGVLLLLIFESMLAFYIASFFIGFSRGSRSMLFSPCVQKLSGLSDASAYYAIIPLLMLPFSSGLPIGTGKLIDVISGGAGYRISFSILAGLILLSIYFLKETDYPESSG
jgi:MFS family permease